MFYFGNQNQSKIPQKENKNRKLYNNKQINTTIDTNYRIFKVETYENEVVLVNLNDAYLLLDDIKTLWHLWNFEFEKFSKKDLIKMYNSQKS